MIFGGFGSGKSTAYISLIESLPESVFYLIDTDFAAERNIPPKHAHRVRYVQGDDLRSLMRQTKTEFIPEPRPQDFVIVDMSESLWKYVQVMVGKNKYNFQIDELGNIKEPNPFKERMQYWGDCSYILATFWRTMIKKGCNLIACTGETALVSTGIIADDEQTRGMYSRIGVKPTGGRKDGHYFHTVLHFSKDGPKYKVTTIKDKFTLQSEMEEHRDMFSRTDVTGQRFYTWYWEKYVESHRSIPD